MIRIGKVAATHGLNGTVILTHVVGSSKWLKKDHVLMIEMHKGSYIPHFVTQLKATGEDEYLISLEEIDKVETAKKLVSKPVYVDEAILAGHAKDSPLLWIGFKLKDKKLGDLGKIEDMEEGNL